MIQLNQTFYSTLHHMIDISGLFLDAALIIFLADHYFMIRNSKLKKYPLLFYFVSFVCRCGDGKCIDPDGKELPAGGYEPGDRKRVCGISKGTSGGI